MPESWRRLRPGLAPGRVMLNADLIAVNRHVASVDVADLLNMERRLIFRIFGHGNVQESG
ncbi:hypothetical protein [Thermoleptolyngbya sp.]